MTVYAIALINIADRKRYGVYERGFMEIFSRIAASCLPWTRRRSVKERGWPYTRTDRIPGRRAFRRLV
jgi:hypothetical protein